MNQEEHREARLQDTAEAAADIVERSLESRDGAELFLNRELSWLEFNSRVLAYAEDPKVPLLERIRFLSIFSTNLDEFYMKRVGGLKRQVAAGLTRPGNDGLPPRQQLYAVRERIAPLLKRQEEIFERELRPLLKESGIELLAWDDLREDEREEASRYFRTQIFPVLTPIAVDAGHPFPFISNLSTSLGVALAHPERDEKLFARVKISGHLPQWVRVGESSVSNQYRFIGLADLIRVHIHELFPHMRILWCMPFRVTRNADIQIDEHEAEDIMQFIQEELRQRKFAQVIRLEHGADVDPWILSFLLEELELTVDDVSPRSGVLDYSGLQPLIDLDLPQLKYVSWSPIVPPALQEEASMFHLLRSHDLLVHHPYESFSASVERFLQEASEDPRVISIKMTLYRLGPESPIVSYLIRAASLGKQVVCLVELKARFDEARNIIWAQKLEAAGVHVVYGIPGVKTHAKTILIVRRDPEAIRCYAHIGTGNYQLRTADIYTDLGLFTSKPRITDDLVHFFNFLTGRSLKTDYQTLIVAPINMESKFLSFIEREIENKRRGYPAKIILKMNNLEDRNLILALYRASQAGVDVILLVRGLCCLRPGVRGMSENIRVVSIVGRLLEHARLYYFQNGKQDALDGDFYLGSADWMGRSIHRRVELVAPVDDRAEKEVCWNIIQTQLHDVISSWELQSDGSYLNKAVPDGGEATSCQEVLMNLAKKKNLLTPAEKPYQFGGSNTIPY